MAGWVNRAVPPPEAADRLPGGGDVGVGVVADDAMATESLRQALDLAPVELEPHGHHQQVVADGFTGCGDHSVGLRLERCRAALDPDGTRRDHGGLRAVGFPVGKQTGAGQDPARLVLVNAGGLQDRHIQAGPGPQQLAGDGEAAGTTAHDQHLVMAVAYGAWFGHRLPLIQLCSRQTIAKGWHFIHKFMR